jgi:hypothetical protein
VPASTRIWSRVSRSWFVRALNRQRTCCFLPHLGEDERPNRLGTGRKHPYGEDEPFWRSDFSIDARKRVSLTTTGSAMDPAKGSVRPQVDLANGEGHAARVPPMCDVSGIRPSLEDNSAGRIPSCSQSYSRQQRFTRPLADCGSRILNRNQLFLCRNNSIGTVLEAFYGLPGHLGRIPIPDLALDPSMASEFRREFLQRSILAIG